MNTNDISQVENRLHVTEWENRRLRWDGKFLGHPDLSLYVDSLGQYTGMLADREGVHRRILTDLFVSDR